MDAGSGPRASRRNPQGFDGAVAVYLDYAVVGQAKPILLIEIPKRGGTRGQCEDREYGCGQLELKFLEHVSPPTCFWRQYPAGRTSTFGAAPAAALYLQIS